MSMGGQALGLMDAWANAGWARLSINELVDIVPEI